MDVHRKFQISQLRTPCPLWNFFSESFGFLLRIIPVLCPTSCFYLPTSCRVVKWDVVHSAGIILKWNLNEFWKEIPKCTRFPQSAVNTEAHLLFSWLSRISGQEGLWGRLRTGKSWEHFFLLKATVTVCLHLNFERFLQYFVVSIILANFIANVVEVDVCPCVIMSCPPLSISFTVFPLYWFPSAVSVHFCI